MAWAVPTHGELKGKQQDAEAAKRYDQKRKDDPQVRFRNSKRWQRFRRWYQGRYPFCADPFGIHAKIGEIKPMQEVHHIRSIADCPELVLTEENVRGLCSGCHTLIELMERRGEPTQELFS